MEKLSNIVKSIKELSNVIILIVGISGAISSAAFFVLDYRYDQRYLKLLELTTKLDPLYISIASAAEQQRIKRIIELDQKIFKLEYDENVLKRENKTLDPFDATTLSKYRKDIFILQKIK